MLQMYTFITSHLAGLQTKRDERGATAVEYGLLVALIAAIIVVTVGLLGQRILAAFELVLANMP